MGRKGRQRRNGTGQNTGEEKAANAAAIHCNTIRTRAGMGTAGNTKRGDANKHEDEWREGGIEGTETNEGEI